MEYRWIKDIEEFRRISKDWDGALAGSGAAEPFLLSDFIDTWWRYYSGCGELNIFVVFDKGRIAGGIPLYIKRGNGIFAPFRILSCIGGSVSNYTEPFYAGGGIKIIQPLKEALALRKDWDILYLPDIREASRLVEEFRENPDGREFWTLLAKDHLNWAIDLSAGKDKYLSTLSGKLKRDLRAKRRRLNDEYGAVKLTEIRGADEVRRSFDKYVDFSLSAFDARDRDSNFEDKRYSGFFGDFLVAMDRQGKLAAHALMAGDNILALSFGYRFNRAFNWVLTGFDYKYRYYRPGYLLIEELINDVIGRGETYYNWYAHERFYKTQWCNDRTPLYRFMLIRRGLKGAGYRALRAVEDILKSNKAIVGLARKLRHN